MIGKRLTLSAWEVVQETTGFSPNNLVYGYTMCGPLAVLRDDLAEVDPPTNLIDYVNGFLHCLFTAVLSPVLNSPFQAKFTSPYAVERHVSKQNDFIAIPQQRKTSRLS